LPDRDLYYNKRGDGLQRLCAGCPGGKVGDVKPDLSRLAALAGGLGLREHHCLIYEREEEKFAAALPYLRAGLKRGERCLYVADEDSRAAVLDALNRAGTEVDRYLRTGALIIASSQETYFENGRFDPDLWLRFLSQATRDEGAGEFSGLRTILGEMSWVLEGDVSPDTLIDYEARLNRFVRDHDVRVLCQYNRNRFSPELILSVLRTHPVVVYGGIVSENPYYVPPDEFLKPGQATREVERLLNNILKWQLSLDQLRALAARLHSAREEERIRVAREIHDELGQALTAIKIDLTSLLGDLPEAQGLAAPRSQSILKLLDQTIHSVQRIGTELRPAILDVLGLVAALEWAAKEFQTRTGTKCQISLPDVDIVLDPERATALFRIFQETLTNVARHADATQVDMRLDEENGNLILEVRDNGKGISEEQASAGTSLGILGMRERILLLGGTLTISGTPGTGTTVRVRIPKVAE
jgi:signal transduction histidine kinase